MRTMKSFIAVAMLLTMAETASAKEAVDTILVLATDVSASIWDPTVQRSQDPIPVNEFKLQKEGIVQALRSPEVQEALKNCNPRGVALTYVEWSGNSLAQEVKQVVGWRKLTTAGEMESFANAVAVAPRSFRGYTDVILALGFSTELILNAPFTAPRRIIDISSDGVANIFGWSGMNEESFIAKLERGPGVQAARDKIVNMGITINALTIEGEDLPLNIDNLRSYYERHVIGGPESFLVPINDFGDYGSALIKKLTRELCPFTS